MLRRSCFKIADLSEVVAPVQNQNRGFYQIFQVELGENIDYDTFESCLTKAENLVLLMVDISNYREEVLTDSALSMFRESLAFFIKHGKNLIVRAVYDRKGQAEEAEPLDFSLVKEHLKQILQTMQEYAENIFIYQGLLVGNWGEMHGGRYITKPQLVELCEIANQYLKADTFLCVRKPAQYRMFRTDYGEQTNAGVCRIGLFNDAILASETDMGTYGDENGLRFDAAWTREKELQFMDRICAYAPNGGETVFGEGYVKSLQPQEIIQRFQNMHITYLNRLYDTKMLEYFKTLPYKKGAWKKKSVYDYLEAHLGYRFLVEDAGVTLVERPDRQYELALSVTIANRGFANLYEAVLIELLVVDEERKTYVLGDLQDIKSNESKCLRVVFGKYDRDNKKKEAKLFLKARFLRNKKELEFANAMTEDGVFLGTLSNYK